MVESELRFFEVKVEGVPRHTFELRQAVFGKTPKGLYSVDVVTAIGELVFTVTHPEVFRITDIDESVVSNPAVSVNDGVEAYSAPNKPLQSAFLGVWDDLGPHPIATFQDPEHDRFLAGTSAPLSLDPVGTEIGFVDLDRSSEGCFGFANRRQTTADLKEDLVHRPDAHTCQTGRRARRQVFTKTAEDVTKFGLSDFRRSIVLVNSRHNRSITPLQLGFAS